jgi:hypothetical protein
MSEGGTRPVVDRRADTRRAALRATDHAVRALTPALLLHAYTGQGGLATPRGGKGWHARECPCGDRGEARRQPCGWAASSGLLEGRSVVVSSQRPEAAPEPSSVSDELRRVFTVPALKRSCVAIMVIGLLAPLANVATLTFHDSARQTANAFTSINAGVFLALLLGVLGTTGSSRLPPGFGPAYRRAVGVKARAYGLVGAASVLLLGLEAAAVMLPIIHARGLRTPSFSVIDAYFQREIVVGARLALLGSAIGIIAVRRGLAVTCIIGFMAGEAVAAAAIPFVRNYGPIGALNAFSDPSHHHQLAVASALQSHSAGRSRHS